MTVSPVLMTYQTPTDLLDYFIGLFMSHEYWEAIAILLILNSMYSVFVSAPCNLSNSIIVFVNANFPP